MAASKQAGFHDGPGWRMLACAAVFLAAFTSISLWLGMLAFGLICLFGAVVGAFLAGYCFRQQVLNIGIPAMFKILQLREDLRPDDDPRP